MHRILVIEDEEPLQRVLSYNLEQAGHEVTVVGTGSAGIAAARSAAPDCVLLDLMLPDISGKEVLRELAADPNLKHVPVVVVTAKGEEVDRVVAFEIGAADYVVKPFSVRELVLRVNAVLRRTVTTPRGDRLLRAGVLRLDPEGHRAWVDETEIELTLLEFRLLVMLYENRGRVLPRAHLLDTLWGADVSMTSRTIDTHINRMRDKLGKASAYVETVRGVGYRFLVRDGDDADPVE